MIHATSNLLLALLCGVAGETVAAANVFNFELNVVNKSGCTLATDWSVTVTDQGDGSSKVYHPNVPLPGDDSASTNVGLFVQLKKGHSYLFAVKGHCLGDLTKVLQVAGTYPNVQYNVPINNPDHCKLDDLVIPPPVFDTAKPSLAPYDQPPREAMNSASSECCKSRHGLRHRCRRARCRRH